MESLGGSETSENPENNIEISPTQVTAHFPRLELSKEMPQSQLVRVTVEKQPMELKLGKRYGKTIIDQESEKMKKLAEEAAALQSLPEIKRPAELLKILSTHMIHAHTLVDYEGPVDPWIETNFLIPYRAKQVSRDFPLSQLIEHGAGVCDQLAVAYLWLASKAGLKGTFMTAHAGDIINVQREDTGEPLFTSIGLTQTTDGHAWAEVQLSDGKWIPVEPTTKLVGDTPEGLATFRKAGYLDRTSKGIQTNSSDPRLLAPIKSGITLRPGDTQATGYYYLELASIHPDPFARNEAGEYITAPATNTPFNGSADLRISTNPDGEQPLKILNANVEPKLDKFQSMFRTVRRGL